MKRNDFLKNALMAVAISLLPKVLRPADDPFAGKLLDGHAEPFENFAVWIPRYDSAKSYMMNLWGGQYWMSGAALNWMDQHFHDEYQKSIHKYGKEVQTKKRHRNPNGVRRTRN